MTAAETNTFYLVRIFQTRPKICDGPKQVVFGLSQDDTFAKDHSCSQPHPTLTIRQWTENILFLWICCCGCECSLQVHVTPCRCCPFFLLYKTPRSQSINISSMVDLTSPYVCLFDDMSCPFPHSSRSRKPRHWFSHWGSTSKILFKSRQGEQTSSYLRYYFLLLLIPYTTSECCMLELS